jgi:putative transposase
MDNKYIHGRTCVYKLNYHLVWCTKYRRKVLGPNVAARLYELLDDVAADKGFTIVEARVGEADHVHCFVSASPKLSVTDIARWLKGISGRHLLMEFPELSEKLWRGHLWNGSYFVESIGSTSEDNILRYIERQKNVQL